MKQIIAVLALSGLFLLSAPVFSQEKGMKPDKYAQMMQMMQDSTMMRMVMQHIAADGHMRQMMMHQMMTSVKGDSTQMREMVRMMMSDNQAHGMMMQMMGGGMMNHNVMMEKKSPEGKMKEMEHMKHHQK